MDGRGLQHAQVAYPDNNPTRMDTVRLVSDANVTTSSTATIDGVAVANKDKVLLTNQTSDVDNGIWRVDTAGDWRRLFVQGGMAVTVREGDDYAGTLWMSTDEAPVRAGVDSQTWQEASGGGTGDVVTVDFASVANISSLNTNPTVDGFSWGDGDMVLVKDQSGGTGNGVYTVQTSGTAWVLLDPQPFVVTVLNGTVNGQQTFFNTTSTTWKSNRAVYA